MKKKINLKIIIFVFMICLSITTFCSLAYLMSSDDVYYVTSSNDTVSVTSVLQQLNITAASSKIPYPLCVGDVIVYKGVHFVLTEPLRKNTSAMVRALNSLNYDTNTHQWVEGALITMTAGVSTEDCQLNILNRKFEETFGVRPTLGITTTVSGNGTYLTRGLTQPTWLSASDYYSSLPDTYKWTFTYGVLSGSSPSYGLTPTTLSSGSFSCGYDPGFAMSSSMYESL